MYYLVTTFNDILYFTAPQYEVFLQSLSAHKCFSTVTTLEGFKTTTSRYYTNHQLIEKGLYTVHIITKQTYDNEKSAQKKIQNWNSCMEDC